MTKIQLHTYSCLAFCAPEIRELIQLFQKYLLDIEIVIDGIHISNIAQLEKFEQFDPPYQATSLVARGYGPAIAEYTENQGERLLIELKMTKMAAFLRVWNKVEKVDPLILVQIKALLSRHLNRNQQSSTVWRLITMLIPSTMLVTNLIEQHIYKVSIVQFLLTIVVSVLLIPTSIVINYFVARLLKIETTVFLLPGTMSAKRGYGWGEVVGRLLVALVLSVAIGVGLLSALRMLWG